MLLRQTLKEYSLPFCLPKLIFPKFPSSEHSRQPWARKLPTASPPTPLRANHIHFKSMTDSFQLINRSQEDQTSQQLLCSTTKWPVRGGHHGRAPPCDWRLYFLFLAGVRTSSRQGGRGSQRHQRPCAATEDQTSLNLVPYTTMVPPGLAYYPKDKRIYDLAREYPIYCFFLRFTFILQKMWTPLWKYGHKCYMTI